MKLITYSTLAILVLTVGCQGKFDTIQDLESSLDLRSSDASIMSDSASLSVAAATARNAVALDGQTVTIGTSLPTTLKNAHKVYRGGVLILKTSAIAQHVVFEDSKNSYELLASDKHVITVRHLSTNKTSSIYLDHARTHLLIGFKDASLKIKRMGSDDSRGGAYSIMEPTISVTGIGVHKGDKAKLEPYIVGQIRYPDHGITFERESEKISCAKKLSGKHISGGLNQQFSLSNPLKIEVGEHVEHFIRNQSSSSDIVALKQGGRYTAINLKSNQGSDSTPPSIVLEGSASDYIVRRHPLTDHLIIENKECGESVNYLIDRKKTLMMFLAFKDCTAAIYNSVDPRTNEPFWAFLKGSRINKTASSQIAGNCTTVFPEDQSNPIHKRYFGR